MVYNVKDYGAIGNGVADDTTAIRNALSACKCVYFPGGTYLVDLNSGALSLTMFLAAPSINIGLVERSEDFLFIIVLYHHHCK